MVETKVVYVDDPIKSITISLNAAEAGYLLTFIQTAQKKDVYSSTAATIETRLKLHLEGKL